MKYSIQLNRGRILLGLLIFIGLPLLFYGIGDYPRRTIVKETISLVTILSFFMVLAQFYLTPGKRHPGYSGKRLITLHSTMGYIAILILLVHPLLLVVPRHFEAGLGSSEALMTIITTWSSPGLVAGIVAWSLLFILGLTSITRKKLPISRKNWQLLHNSLAALFIVAACYHGVDLGRHTNLLLSSYIITLLFGGMALQYGGLLVKHNKDQGTRT